MRRVYYTYGIRVLSNPTLLHGLVMFGLLLVLTRFVSAAHVMQNLSGVRVGQLGHYAYDAVTHTEVWTLFLAAALIYTALSFRIQLKSFRVHTVHTEMMQG
ncbi:hypothetical protein COU16_00395 [Candidatus Kaiserbacteria bacterium CG10_big_fil_rev_8_21_14_0_10_47_16]|uniref:Uncharacterized protein n=1 Tax=Candidatus Kaiserbacteria bacterium CG10_big_fil_rev_8_21_14_0_10_47_16 TaxID=1974608 RepID=A0A2H0UEI7_9BACT|nr:MAG: hypothetical protein COU16_00395 [Candidatus Kaiserbacteria bacterium CG10_big_fil_rev_8_21_14_0_10_47_16]